MMISGPTPTSLRLVAQYHRACARRMEVWERDRALYHIDAAQQCDLWADALPAPGRGTPAVVQRPAVRGTPSSLSPFP